MILANRHIGEWSFLSRSLVNDSWWFRDPAHLPQSAYYRPLQDVWLALHYHAFGLNPVGWHVTMIALHVAAVLLVFRLADLLSGSRASALLTAALFGLLPIHAEAVVWPSAVPLPLAAVLELGAFVIAVQARKHSTSIAALALFAAALMAHESAIVFPFLLVAYDLILGVRAENHALAAPVPLPRKLRESIHNRLPFLFILAVYFLIRLSVLGFIARPNPFNSATPAQVLLTIPGAMAHYLLLLVCPWLGGPSHRFFIVGSVAEPAFYIPMIGLLIIAGVALWGLSSGRRNRLHIFCVAWVVIALLPVLNLGGLFPQGLIQDRYLYLPSFGYCLLIADAMTRAMDRGFARPVIIGSAAIAAAYALFLVRTQRFWRDDIVLFAQCASEFPECSLWHSRLGMALANNGQLAAAVIELRRAHVLEPDDGASLYDLGEVEARQGDFKTASRDLASGLELLPHAPAPAYVQLAIIADAAGDTERSATALKTASNLPGGAEFAALALGRIELRRERSER